MSDAQQWRSRIRRALRWPLRFVGFLLALVALVLLTLALAFYTEVGTRLALTQGASIYGGMIPGDVSVREVEGTLAGGVTLRGVRLEDRRERPLITAGRVSLRANPFDLAALQVRPGTIRIDDLDVHVIDATVGGFADLGPQGSEPTPPKPGPIGPDLPVSIVGEVEVSRARIFEVTPGFEPVPWIEVPAFAVSVDAEGTRADATAQGRASMPAQNLEVFHVSLDAGWASPVASVDALLVQSNAATVEGHDVSVDFEREAFALEQLQLRGDARWLSERAGMTLLHDVDVTLAGSGATDAFSADVWANAPSLASVGLAVEGAVTSTFDLDALLDLALDPSAALADLPRGPITLLANAHLRGDLQHDARARLDARCDGCLNDAQPLEIHADASGGLESDWASVDASVEGSGVVVEAGAIATAWDWVVARASVDIDDLRALQPVLSVVAPGLDLAGTVDVDALCGLEMQDLRGGCWTRAEVTKGRPVDAALVEAVAWTPGSKRLSVVVGALSLDARDAQIRQRSPATRVWISPRRVAVDDLSLTVRNASGSGTVSVRGRLGLEGNRAIAATVRLSDLSLSAIDAFVPSFRGRGVLDARLDADGSLSSPAVSADVRGEGLGALGLDLGALDLRARYRDARASAEVHLVGRDVGDLRVEARVPLTVDVDGGRFELPASSSASLDASIAGAPLSTLSRFVPTLQTLTGQLDATLSVGGRLRSPDVRATVSVEGASLQGHVLPDVALVASYAESSAGGLATLDLDAEHPSAFDLLSVDAAVPLDLNLARPRARWRQGREHTVRIVLEGGQVGTIGEWRPEIEAQGEVDVNLSVRGTAVSPRIDATLHTKDVTYTQRPVGDVALSARYADDEASLRLHASGPEVSGLGLVASVPVTLDPVGGAATWHADRAHRVRLSISELLLGEAVRWLPPPEDAPQDPLDVHGRLSAYVALDGTARDPRASADVTVERASYGGRPVGQVELAASYADTRARVELDWEKTPRHTAHASVEVPVAVDLERGEFGWTREGEHHVRVAVPLLDRVLLDPFVDTGDLNAAAAVHVVLDGTPDAFDGGASVVGSLRAHGQHHRLRADVDVTQDAQSLTLDLGLGDATSSWAHVEGTLAARVPELLDGGDWKTTAFEVDADVRDVDLAQISGLMPVVVQDLRGRLTVHARMDGTLGDPRVDGRVALRGGEATVVPLRQRLRGIELAASLDNERVEVTRLKLTSGGGSLSGRGAVDIAKGAGLAGRIDLDIDRMPIRRPGLPRLDFSGEIATLIDVGLEEASVEVDIASGRVDVATSRIKAPKSVPTNDNVGFVDFDEPPPRDVTYIPPKDDPAKRTTEIKVVLVDPLKIIGPSVDMEWGGSIQANTSDEGATADGALRAEGGGFELLGNEFGIERGIVTLPDDGSNVPFIDLVAKTSVEDVGITASIRGPVVRPTLDLRSSPSMSESDIFTVLVTGSTDTQSADSEQVEAKAAGVLAAVSNPALQRQLNDKLKVDKVGVGFGDTTDQPILTVGKHVSKDVYAETEYHHNAPQNENRAELRVEYDFAPRWSLETFFGDAAAGGVDVFWGRAFDTERNLRE